MIFLVCLMFGGLLLTCLLEECSWEEEPNIRQLIKQSLENERGRMEA